MFHQLQDALQILIDESARAAYNRILKAKKENEIRNRQLDSKRQKLKSDLEAREKEASSKKSSNYSDKTLDEIFKIELERVMKENSKLIEEENEIIRQQIYKNQMSNTRATTGSQWDSSKHRIKIKWKAEKEDSTNGGYNKENLTKFLYKYGDIVAVIVSAKKKGSGMVEFKNQEAAEMAVAYEKGIQSNPLKLEWIGDPPKSLNRQGGATINERDYESLVLRQMRQAEERKKLIEQMKNEDQDDD